MKILYITTLYTRVNSSAAIRNNALVKGLTELGHEVYVHTVDWGRDESAFFNQERNGKIYKYHLNITDRINFYKDTIVKKSSIFQFFVPLIKSILFFPDNTKEWIRNFNYEDIDERYDIMITSSDTKSSHFVGYKIKKLFPSIKWIQIWGDPWTHDVNTPWHIRLFTSYYESKLFVLADKIVYVSELTSELMRRKKHRYSNKICYIPRSYYYQCDKDIDITSNPIKIVYTGTLSYGRDIKPIIHAINVYNETRFPKIELHVYGDANINNGHSVFCHGSVDYSEMHKVYYSGDMFLFISNGGDTTQIPGKLYDYLGCSQPILCLCSSTQVKLIHYLKTLKKCIVLNNTEEDICRYLTGLDSTNITRHIGVCDEYSPKSIAMRIIG